MANLAIGEVRKDFEIISECISRGAMAKGHRAQKGDRIVYLKQYLSPKPSIDWYDGYVRYQRELKRRIQSSSLKDFCYEFIDFFEATRPPRNSEATRQYYQVFEWVDEGKDLSHIIAELKENSSAYTWEQRLIWAKVIMGSIARLHEQNIAHIDLKPENLILIPAEIGAGYRLKLIDMDFSILTDKQAPWHGISGYVGTPGWLSPEHVQGDIPDSASDVFTCGLILYDLLGQGNPYKNSSSEDEYKDNILSHSAEKVELSKPMPKGNDRSVIDILYRCLAVNPTERPTAKEVNVVLIGAGYVPEEVEVEPVEEETEVLPHGQLELQFDSGTLRLRITTTLNMRSVKQFGEDSRFWDKDEQMKLEKTADIWSVTHNEKAPNETLLNGGAVVSKQVLKNGDKLAVGRERTGISKMPITVRIV